MKNKIYITGDIHGSYDIKKLTSKKFPEQKQLTKKDFLIICGDFGLLWEYEQTKKEKYWLDWLNDKNFTTLVIDGNHENHDLFDRLPIEQKFNSEVGLIHDSIFHLKRGNVYNINTYKILAIGGAHSHDRQWRSWGESMWKQEEITQKDIDKSFKNLSEYNNTVDYIVSHCAPTEIVKQKIPLYLASKWIPDHSEENLQQILDKVFFEKWYFGHYHVDVEDTISNKWICLYHEIVEI